MLIEFKQWTINNFEYYPLEFWIRATPIILSLTAIGVLIWYLI